MGTIVTIAIAVVILAAAGVIHISEGVIVVVMIIGVIAFLFFGVAEMAKDETARKKWRDYWLKK